MQDIWAEIWVEIVLCFNAIINAISTYVHSTLAFEINTYIAAAFKELADYTVYIIRDILDVFGR